MNQIPNDNVQLITNQQFENGTLGLAHVGSMCYRRNSCGVNSNYKTRFEVLGRTITHEMGHNLGMAHDDEQCDCNNRKCMMYDKSSMDVTLDWSSCSKNAITKHLKTKDVACLKNKPKTILKTGSSFCGNGFVEFGEECDCGMPAFCQSKCCDAKTCKLFNNATCGSGDCCDHKSCQIKEAGTLCRRSESDCDLPEYCTGSNEYCPDDLSKIDTTSCKGDAGFCYKGECEIRDAQCQIYLGQSSFSMPGCYKHNVINPNKKETRDCGKLQCSKNGEPSGDFATVAITIDNECTHVIERFKTANEQTVYVKNGFYN